MRAIVAACDDWGIGLKGDLLVRNPEDMRHYVRLTKHGVVVMGRKTLQGFPGSKPLRGRRNVVVTRGELDPALWEGLDDATTLEVVHTPQEALDAVADADPSQVWLIGGASLYEQLIDECSEAVVTFNHCTVPADTYFPNLDERAGWQVASRELGGTTPDGIDFDYVTYTHA